MPDSAASGRVAANALSLDDFRLVRAIAASKGLAGAADALGVNHSTVFRRLGHLEDVLGCKLFERHRAGYALTPSGEEMAAVAARMDEDAATFLRKVEGKSLTPSGELRVTTNDGLLMVLLTPIFAAFRQAHPQIRLDVVLGNASLNLSKRDADIAIRATDRPPDTLIGRRIGSIAWAIYGRATDYPEGGPVDCESTLKDKNWIGLGEELASVKAARFVRDRVGSEQVVYRINTVRGVAEAIEAGIGIGPLPCIAAQGNPALVRLTVPHADISGTLWLLTHPDLRHAARVRAFMDFVGTELTRRRPMIEGENV